MPTFYHSPGGRRRRGLSLAVVAAAALAALNAGAGTSATDIALITAIVLVATGIIGLGTYLLVRAARPTVTALPPVARVTATVIRAPGGEVRHSHAARAIQGKQPVSVTALALSGDHEGGA